MPIKPPEFTLLTNQKDRLGPEPLPLFVDALLDKEHKDYLTIRYISKVLGPPHREWVEVRADNHKGSFTLCFGVQFRSIVQLWVVLTPSGRCYDIDQEGGNPFLEVPIHRLQALTRLLIEETGVIELRPMWRLVMDGRPVGNGMDRGRSPKGYTYPAELNQGSLFEDEELAQKALKRFTEYFTDVQQKPQEVKPKTKVKKKGAP